MAPAFEGVQIGKEQSFQRKQREKTSRKTLGHKGNVKSKKEQAANSVKRY